MKYVTRKLIVALSLSLPIWPTPAIPCDFSKNHYISDEAFFDLDDTSRESCGWCRPEENTANAWNQAVAKLDLSTMSVARGYGAVMGCNYKDPVRILSELSDKYGFTSAYVKRWVQNQQIVLDTCASTGSKTAPLNLDMTNLPVRAKKDFAYQAASQLFYQQEYDQAKSAFMAIANDPQSPHRGLAALTLIRLMRNNGDYAGAFDYADKVTKDPAFSSVRDAVENQQFVTIYNDHYDNSGQLYADKHLAFAMDIMERPAAKIGDIKTFKANFQDAHTYAKFFARHVEGDWFLNDNIKSSSVVGIAAMKRIKHDNLLDYIATSGRGTFGQSGWIGKTDDIPTESSNKNLADHAFGNWQACKGHEWLVQSMRNMRGDDKNLAEALTAAEDIRQKADLKTHKGYRLSYDLWQQSVRLLATSGQGDEAVKLAMHSPQKKYSDPYSDASDLRGYFSQGNYTNILMGFIGQGDNYHARMLLNTSKEARYGQEMPLFYTIDNQDQLVKYLHGDSIAFKYPYSSGPKDTSEAEFDLVMLSKLEDIYNLMPTAFLADVAQNSRTPHGLRLELARVAFTRAVLLKQTANIPVYAALLDKLSIDGDKSIIKAAAGNQNDMLLFLLRHPRFSPVITHDKSLKSTQIDSNYISDNNWWCRIPATNLWNNFINGWMPSPAYEKQGDTYHLLKNADAYAQTDAFFRKHPLYQLIDWKELEQLQQIPPAFEYLTTQATIWGQWPSWWRSIMGSQDNNDIAEALHLSVRTTRYSCRRNGPHTEQSKKAFDQLHQNYKNNPWAISTPYWFH